MTALIEAVLYSCRVHHALAPGNIAACSNADISNEHIGGPANYEFPAFLGMTKADWTQQEVT